MKRLAARRLQSPWTTGFNTRDVIGGETGAAPSKKGDPPLTGIAQRKAWPE